MSFKDQIAIILVGGPGQSMLRQAAGHPVCLLPVSGKRSLLESWVDTLEGELGMSRICVLTGRPEDVGEIKDHVAARDQDDDIEISIHADKAAHRGTAGALKDFVNGVQEFQNLLVIEGNRIPPENPRGLLCDRFHADDVVGILGKSSEDETAGMILMKRKMLDLVPALGFFDFKEQLIPRVLESGSKIIVKEITQRSVRLSTPNTYLKQLTEFRTSKSAESQGPYISDSAKIDPGSVLGDNVIIGDNVTIMDGCLIQDSVILEGSFIGSDSTLIRSIITRNSRVEEGTSSIIDPDELNATRARLYKRRFV